MCPSSGISRRDNYVAAVKQRHACAIHLLRSKRKYGSLNLKSDLMDKVTRFKNDVIDIKRPYRAMTQ